jgi:hypothetical protein
MHVSPKRLLELDRGDDPAGVRDQKPERCQLARGEMNEGLSSEK